MARRRHCPRAWAAYAHRGSRFDHRLRSRALWTGRHAAGGRRTFLYRSVARAGPRRFDRACRFRGAGASRGEHGREHSWPYPPARFFPAAGDRETRGGAQGKRAAGQSGRNRDRVFAVDRGWRARYGRVIQGHRHRRTGARPASGIRRPVTMIEASSLSLTGIRHAFFTRSGGVSGGIYASLNGGIGSRDAPENVAGNRGRMAGGLGGEPRRLVTPLQIHSPDVVVAEAPWPIAARPRADAIVTRMRALAIGVTTADCGPVLLADPQAHVIGAAHAGWRGALAGVIEATVEAMERLGAARRHTPARRRCP